MTTKDTIRRDIYSVKVRGNGFNQWCHERMFRSPAAAKLYANGLRPISGYSLTVRVVHPAQWVVDGFLAAGNEIA